MMRKIYEKLLEKSENGNPAVMYSLLDGGGDSKLTEGARLLVLKSGEKYGTLGIDLLDNAMEDRAKQIFKNAASQTGIVEYPFSEKKIKILEDCYFPEKRLLVYGGGHVALPLTQIASILGYQVVVIDDRPGFANRERFPGADEVICANFSDVLTEEFINEKIHPSTSVVIVTRSHEYDKICLESVIRSRARYIGMIGSKNKVRAIFMALLNAGVPKEELQKVSAPIGLDLGGQKPAEIALSILAEIVARENNRAGRILKDVEGGLLDEPGDY